MVVTSDMRTDARWTELGRQVHEATTVVSMLSYLLHLEMDENAGSLTL